MPGRSFIYITTRRGQKTSPVELHSGLVCWTVFFFTEGVSLTCSMAHSERKQIDVRSLKRVQCDVLEADLIGVNIDRGCTDVNLVIRQYDASLSSLLDKHTPSKRIYVVERPMNDWMTDDILVLKALRRKYESLWRKTRLTVHFDMYSESCMDVKTAISNSKSVILQNKISDCNGDQKKNFAKFLTPYSDETSKLRYQSMINLSLWPQL